MKDFSPCTGTTTSSSCSDSRSSFSNPRRTAPGPSFTIARCMCLSTFVFLANQMQGQPNTRPAPKMVACNGEGVLALTLQDGILLDNQGRTGYIASNFQFQFDKPAQAGAIYTSGWSVCGNGSLALGGSTTFYQCLSGNFYNLYSENWAAQCNAVTIDVLDLVGCPSS